MKKAGILVPVLTLFWLVLMEGCIRQTEAEMPAVQQAVPLEEPEEEAADEEKQTMPEEARESEQAVTEGSDTAMDQKQEEEISKTEIVPQKDLPKVKGIYITGPMAGHEGMADREQLAADTELNAMVIDIKNDEGIVSYKMDQPMVEEMGAGVRYIRDLPELIERLKGQDLYLIARIVAFKDPLLADKHPELCIRKKDGSIFRDKNGLAWVNPYEREVWEYLIDLGKEAALAGFDEIQFDYIRFPTEITDEEADYGTEALGKSKTDIITEFTAYAYEQLSPLGIQVSADVFGTVIDNENDAALVGQDYGAMARHLDYICPMVYPSHYREGVYGIEYPDLMPYETVSAALEASGEILAGIPKGEHRAVVRPWLQDFTAVWISHRQSYEGEQIREQIQAVYDSGCEEWLLWNAKCSYTAEGLLSED